MVILVDFEDVETLGQKINEYFDGCFEVMVDSIQIAFLERRNDDYGIQKNSQKRNKENISELSDSGSWNTYRNEVDKMVDREKQGSQE